jgi:hypothetical protein
MGDYVYCSTGAIDDTRNRSEDPLSWNVKNIIIREIEKRGSHTFLYDLYIPFFIFYSKKNKSIMILALKS